jgi:hypothetical protein
MSKKKCDKCGYLFSTRAGNYERHMKSCDGTYLPPSKVFNKHIRECKHCKDKFDISDKPSGWMANHTRWCDSNPKRGSYNKDLSKARAARKNFNNQFTYGATVSDETKEKQRLASTGKKHSEETKEKMRKSALSSNHRRLKKGTVEYNGVLLDSSWEIALAKRLDDLGISWIRPEPIKWTDKEDIAHNYFPDFYLPEYDLYLDPKNEYARNVQKEKLDILLTEHKNIVIIKTLEECKNFEITGRLV